MSLKLSVLDQSVAMSGRGQDESIRQTVALAIEAERLGYARFWVSEHHAHPSIVGTAPEILMAAIATQTQKIRIGSAGVMLPHYAALKVAEQFRVLDALAPGRIDLGVGRAPGSDGKTAQLLNPDRYASENFPQQVMELQAWVKGQPLPPGHPGHGVFAYPQSATSPDVWMLGSSDYGAQLAAHLGLPYCLHSQFQAASCRCPRGVASIIEHIDLGGASNLMLILIGLAAPARCNSHISFIANIARKRPGLNRGKSI